MFIDIGIITNLAPLLVIRTLQQVIDSVSLVYFIQLSTIIANVFKIQPGVQEQTYDAYTRKEEGRPKETVARVIFSLINNFSDDCWCYGHPCVLDCGAESECCPNSFFVNNIWNGTPESSCIY